MTLVVPKYRVLLDDSVSVKDPLAHGLIKLVEPQVSVTWDLLPFRPPIRQLTYERGQRTVNAREVVLGANFGTSDTQVTLDATTRKRVTDGHILYHPVSKQRVLLDEVNTSTGVCTIYSVLQAPGGSRTQINSGQKLYILSQAELYEEINAESRFETTTKVTNYIQDTTELLSWSRADLREARKWDVDKQQMLKERMRDVMKDLNLSILYNVPQATDGTVPALTAGFDYLVENAGNKVNAAVSGTADLADIRGVLKQLQKNGVGPADGLFALMSINVFHAYEDAGLVSIDITGQPGAEFVVGNQIRGITYSGIGFVPFYADPHINDDAVRFICQNHAGKGYYQGMGEGAPLESPHLEDEPSKSTSKTPVSSLQFKWGTIIDNPGAAHYLLLSTGLN